MSKKDSRLVCCSLIMAGGLALFFIAASAISQLHIVVCDIRIPDELICNCKTSYWALWFNRWKIHVLENDLHDLIQQNFSSESSKKWKHNSFHNTDLENLEMLTVSSCEEIFRVGNFLSLITTRLRSFTLNSNNKIAKLEEITLSKPNELGRLIIKNKCLSKIEDNAFDQMTELHSLYLHENSLTVFNWRWFTKMTKLRKMVISSNAIKKWTGFEMIVTTSATARNSVETGILLSLRRLDIGFNLLDEIEEQLFERAPNLEYLNLENNRIQFIQRNAFENARNLQTVILRGNQLKTPYRDWFNPVPDICQRVKIDLDNNPWSCDEEILQYFQTQEEPSCNNVAVSPHGLSTVVCSSPDILHGRNLDEKVAECIKNNSYSPCAFPLSPASIAMYVLIPFVVCVGIFVIFLKMRRKRMSSNHGDKKRLLSHRINTRNPHSVSSELENLLLADKGAETVGTVVKNAGQLDFVPMSSIECSNLGASDVVVKTRETALGCESVVSSDCSSTSNGESLTLETSNQIGSTTVSHVDDVCEPSQDFFSLGKSQNDLADSVLSNHTTPGPQEVSERTSLESLSKCTTVCHDDSDNDFLTGKSHALTSKSISTKPEDSASTEAQTPGRVDVGFRVEVAHCPVLAFGQHETVCNVHCKITRFGEQTHSFGFDHVGAHQIASSCPDLRSPIIHQRTAEIVNESDNASSATAIAGANAHGPVGALDQLQLSAVPNWPPGLEQQLPEPMRISDNSSLSFRTASVPSVWEGSSGDSAISSNGSGFADYN